MISLKPNQVIFSHPTIVQYFTKYHKNTTFLTACENLLETFCKNTDDFIFQYTNEQKYDLQTNTIMLQLESLEKKNDEFKDTMNNIGDVILAKVSTQLTTLILSIDNIISSSVSKFNTESLQDFITNAFDENSIQSKFQLEEHVRANIVTPINETQQKLLEQLAKLPDLIQQSSNTELLDHKLQSMNSKWLATIDSVILEIKQLEHNMDTYNKFANDSAQNSPLVIKGVLHDLVSNLEQKTSSISYVVNSIQRDIDAHTTNLALIKSSGDDLKVKVDSLDKQLLAKQMKESNSNSFKGSVAEDTLYNLLSEKLMFRDGFNVTKVNGKSHSCDILIQRDDFPDISIESKAHGQHTGEKVRTKEIEKFERDLHELDNHGIFVSLYTGIIGKGSLEIKQLPNAKFAIYLSKNMYDCDSIKDMIYLLYKLNDIMTTSSTNSCTTLSPESILRIQNHINTFTAKLNDVKTSLKDSITMLNTINLQQIEEILRNQCLDTIRPSAAAAHSCLDCGFPCKSSKGLTNHKRKCLVSNEELATVTNDDCIIATGPTGLYLEA